MPLETGAQAPDFALRDQHGQTVELTSYRGNRPVVLVFYPWAFSRVCRGELRSLTTAQPRFEGEGAVLLGVSCDAMFSLRAFADEQAVTFPLLSDHWPHGAVATAYGVFDDKLGAAGRSTFVIDRRGVIAWAVHNEVSDERELDRYLDVLKAL